MKEQFPLNIKIKQTYSADHPVMFRFEYTDSRGKEETLRYHGIDLSQTEKYLKREDINPDLSEVKTKEDAEKLKKDFMKEYPEADKVYENLFKYEQDMAKSDADFDKMSVFHDCVLNTINSNYENLSKQEQIQTYSFLREALSAQAQGKNLDEIPTPKEGLISKLGLKKDNIHNIIKEIKRTVRECEPQKYAQALKAVSEKLPQTDTLSLEEARKIDAEYRQKYHNVSSPKAYESFKKVAEDFLTIKTKEDAEKTLDKKLSLHLKNLRVKEKVAQKDAERAQRKAEQEPLNKAAGKQKQMEAKKRTAAKERLQEKGLMPKEGSRNGKTQNWGDSIALMKKMKDKSNG